MAYVSPEILAQFIEAEGLHLVETPAAAAYLDHLVQPIATFVYNGLDVEVETWYKQHADALHLREDEINYLDSLVQSDGESKRNQLTNRLIDHITVHILRAAVEAGSDRVQYEALALTPWDIRDGLSSFGDYKLGRLLLGHPRDEHEARPDLPVSVVIRGNSFTHLMNMDLAMGILLLSQTVGVDLRMTVYGAPLTYFTPGTDDIYDTMYWDPVHDIGYDADVEFSLRMINGTRQYHFYYTDFLLGIKTAAEWLGLDHHVYWDSLQDGRGTPITF